MAGAAVGVTALPPPAPSPGGITPPAISREPTKSTAKTLSVPVGKRGAGMFSRCPVASALTVSAYSLRASLSHPRRPIAVIRTPATKTAGWMTRPSSIAAAAIEARSGRNDGPGMWTPGGGPSWTTAGSAVGASRASYSRIASRPQ